MSLSQSGDCLPGGGPKASMGLGRWRLLRGQPGRKEKAPGTPGQRHSHPPPVCPLLPMADSPGNPQMPGQRKPRPERWEAGFLRGAGGYPPPCSIAPTPEVPALKTPAPGGLRPWPGYEVSVLALYRRTAMSSRAIPSEEPDPTGLGRLLAPGV